jgi:hypothetical protein
MTSTPGHIYRVGTRFFVDSQALRQIAEHLDLVPTASGYRFLEPAIELELVEGRPRAPEPARTALPRPRGQLRPRRLPRLAATRPHTGRRRV